MSSSTWAIKQISQLLPLDEESIQQILDYTTSLPKDATAEHLKNLLGDSPKALDFISSFNARRETSKPTASVAETADISHKPRKKKAPLNKLPPPRRTEDHGNTMGAYNKKSEEDYMPGASRPRKEPPLANALALSDKPAARQAPTPTSKLPPSASGPLISSSLSTSRSSSPLPKTKIALSGGPSMHGASTTLQDLDSAIRALELQTNPSLSTNTSPSSRRCDCLATRHPLLAAAPNCLSCGKIICVKEGIGPCTFCSQPLLSPEDTQAMIRSLREERGLEKMNTNNATHRRADLAATPRAFTPPPAPTSPEDTTLLLARQHRDKLLAYQSDNARRTHIIDEAADFDTPSSGQSMWSSPVERAKQLKRQQKVLREQEWSAKPEYEKRRVVVSVDLVGGKVVKRMGKVDRPEEPNEDPTTEEELHQPSPMEGEGEKGAFSKNPLLSGLIRPIWKPPNPQTEEENKENETQVPLHPHAPSWRRVQDDETDNEAWILDGGVYGGREIGGEKKLGDEERAKG